MRNCYIFIDGFTSASANTIESLTRALNLTKNYKITPSANIIALANNSGFTTYWVSNQGKIGTNDTSIAKIGMQSHKSYFLKRGEFMSFKNIPDFDMLPMVEKYLKEYSNNAKLVVIHQMGSHHRFCDRIMNNYYPKIEKPNKNLSCYLSTINELDKFMSSLVDLVKREYNKYSILYMSDHALARTEKKGLGGLLKPDFDLKVNPKSSSSFDIPLFIISDDISEHTIIKTKLSGFDFFRIFSSWLGIHSELYKNLNMNTHTSTDIKVFNFENLISPNTLIKDPIVVDNN